MLFSEKNGRPTIWQTSRNTSPKSYIVYPPSVGMGARFGRRDVQVLPHFDRARHWEYALVLSRSFAGGIGSIRVLNRIPSGSSGYGTTILQCLSFGASTILPSLSP